MFVLLGLVLVVDALKELKSTKPEMRSVFRKYEAEFGKSYTGREEKERFGYFRKSYIDVLEHNKHQHKDYSLEINKFSDLNEEEKKHFLGLMNHTEIVSNVPEEDHAVVTKRSNEPLEVDHRKAGLVTPVKNQLQCGSCWAFSGVAAFESAYKQTTGYLKSFSEQELLDCYYKDSTGRDACRGGHQQSGLIYIKYKKRLSTYNDYTYTGKDGKCNKASLPSNGIKNARLSSYKWIISNNDAEVQSAASTRVLSVALYASTMFAYRSGVFTGCPARKRRASVNHAMVLTGYTQQTWILKNSWGVNWGENGYIRIGRDYTVSDCRVTNWIVYPIVKYFDNGEQDKEDIHAEQDDDDVALTGTASQRSTSDPLGFGSASNAIDGNTNGNYSAGSCSRSLDDYINWWVVRFDRTHAVRQVKIHLPSDDDASLSDIDGATVHVGNRGDYLDPVCGRSIDSSLQVNYEITINCNGLSGRYVTVDWYFANHPSRSRRSMTLCEVQIYAHDSDEGCPGGNVKCSDGLCKPPSFC